MQFIFEKLYELVNKKEYSKLFRTVTFSFAFLAPSVSYVFIFHNNLFMSLDIVKLLLISIVVNLTFIFTLFLILFTINDQKMLDKTIDNVGVHNEDKNIFNKNSEYTFYETILHALSFTAVMWIYCFANKLVNAYVSERIYLLIIFLYIVMYVIVIKINNWRLKRKNKKI